MDNNYQQNPYQQPTQPQAQPQYQQTAYQQPYQQPYQQAAYQQNSYQQPYQQTAYQNPYQQPESKFDGSVLDCFIYTLGASCIISFTFGIATPWAICMLYKFILSHVLIDGKRLTFDGNGGRSSATGLNGSF